MKKGILILILVLLAGMLALPASAAEGDPAYAFVLAANGQDTLEVHQGDVLTVTLRLQRTDEQKPGPIYGMQAELRYDADFLELVEGGSTAYTGVSTTDIALVDNHREYYMNFLSFSGGTTWEADTLVGSVQFRVIGDSGVARITNEDFLVSLPDGSGSYACTANELLLILSTDCTVRFQTNGGTPVEPVTAIFGELLPRPEDPVREGYHLAGWYRDIHLSEEWNFEEDTVQGNMTLYAKWEAGEPQSAEPGMNLCLWFLLILLILLLLLLLIWLRRRKKQQPEAG